LSKRCNATTKLKDGQGIVHARISEAKATQMCRREKKGGKREERRGRKDRGRKNERKIHAGGSEGEERSEGESERARKRKPRNSSGTGEAALEKAPQKTVLADWPLPYLHCHK
jgi:hypothetical protein